MFLKGGIMMSPNKVHSCLDLQFDFPGGCTHWNMDLDYIKTNVMTHRSNHSCEISVDASCYYEAAKTLLDLLNLFYLSGCLMDAFTRIHMVISPVNEEDVPYVSLVAYAKTNDNTDRDVIISMMYSNAKSIKTEHGIFTIRVSVGNMDTNNLRHYTLGCDGVLMAEYIMQNTPAWALLDPHGDDGCWIAENILKYSENFPAPTIMINKIDHMFVKINNDYDRYIAETSGNCVAGWTKVLTDEGEKEIRTLDGNVVKIWNGEVYSVSRVESFKNDQTCIIVSFNNGRQLFVTAEHTFIMATGEHKLAKDLKLGDCLAAWKRPDGTADVACVTELQVGPVLGVVYHVQDPLQHKAMYDGIITVN